MKLEIGASTDRLGEISRAPWQVKLDMDKSGFDAKLRQALMDLGGLTGAVGSAFGAVPSAPQTPVDPRPPGLRSIELQMDGKVVGRITSERLRRDGEAGYGIPLGVSG
jgi:hypothetical protein